SDGVDRQHVAHAAAGRARLSAAEAALSPACFSRQEPRDAIASPVRAIYAARVARDATALPHVQTTQRASRATRQRCPTCKLRNAHRAQRDSIAPRANYTARVTRNATALPRVQTTQRALRATRQRCPTCKLRSARNATALPHVQTMQRASCGREGGILGGREVF
ncbi:MAG: hypothetical protein GY820_42665, partial [Gammaproteobacteria bacterium]|nr:hypothetical protein [Gammaproteobacteria bacterium]